MSDEARTNAILQQVFADEDANVYAVLDGASVPELPQKLWQHGPRSFCLFTGELEPDMAEVAPYIVELHKQAAFARLLADEGWGEHWGVYLRTEANLVTARAHCRRVLNVVDEDGTSMYFRFYDPRVLPKFLDTCEPNELAEVFGPVTAWMMEDEDPARMLTLRLEGEQCRKRSTELKGAPTAQT